MKAKVNGIEIFFDVEGTGLVPKGHEMVEKRTCYVLHGGPGADHSYFRPWMSPLAEDLQLVYVDHRGNGRSSRMASENYTIEAMADDLEALREYLGLGEMVVMGNSFGGFVSLMYATRYPANVSHLILISTAPSYEFWVDAQERAEKMATPEMKAVIPTLFSGDLKDDEEYARWWDTVLPLYFHNFDKETGKAFNDRIVHSLEVSNYMFKHEIPKYDVRPQLEKITAKTLVMAGRYDWVTPVTQSEEIHRLIPQSNLVVFENSGHMPFIEEQGEFVRTVREFMTQ